MFHSLVLYLFTVRLPNRKTKVLRKTKWQAYCKPDEVGQPITALIKDGGAKKIVSVFKAKWKKAKYFFKFGATN